MLLHDGKRKSLSLTRDSCGQSYVLYHARKLHDTCKFASGSVTCRANFVGFCDFKFALETFLKNFQKGGIQRSANSVADVLVTMLQWSVITIRLNQNESIASIFELRKNGHIPFPSLPMSGTTRFARTHTMVIEHPMRQGIILINLDSWGTKTFDHYTVWFMNRDGFVI